MENDEAALIASVLDGDDSAFDRLVRQHQGVVRALLRRLTNDHAMADDLAQNTFVQAWQKLAGFRGGNFRSWLCAIAYRMWLQQLRRAGNVRDTGNDPELLAGDSENPGRTRDFDQALARLSADQRLAVLLSFMAGMSHAEIATATNWPLGTVKSHLARGKTQLRALLEGYADETR